MGLGVKWTGDERCMECGQLLAGCTCRAVDDHAPSGAQAKDADDMAKKKNEATDANAAQHAFGDVAQIYGIDESKLNVEHIDAALVTLKIKAKKATLTEKVGMLKDAFAPTKPRDLGECNACGGKSPIATFPDACPFCGVEETDDGHATVGKVETPSAPAAPVEVAEAPVTKTRALSVVKPVPDAGKVIPVSDLQPDALLDEAVKEIRTLERDSKEYVVKLARRFVDIGVSELWKRRRRLDGTVAYSKIEDFAKGELGFHRAYVQTLQRIAIRFTDQDIAGIGITKLNVIASIDDKDIQQEMLEQVRNDPSIPRREIERAAGRGGKDTRVKKKKNKLKLTHAKPVKAAPTNEIAIAIILGKHKVKLYKKQDTTGAALTPARQIADLPFGYWDVVNDVRVFFSLVRLPTGELRLNIDAKRITPGA